jgi:hypothetical protein
VKDLLRPRHVALASAIVAAPLWAATSGAGARTLHAAKAPASLCENLSGIFSNGPDPDADPVGYALSQIKPLGDVHTSDHAVHSDLTKLIAADRALVASGGSGHRATVDSKDIKKDDHLVNAACPEAAS